jgi:hypothetical protein
MAIVIKQRIGKLSGDQDLDDNLRIVRYIKLSTFLLHLAHKAFIPSLRTLQRIEALEGRIPDAVWKVYGESLWPHLKNFERWLLNEDRLALDEPGLKIDLQQYLHDPASFDDFQRNYLAARIWLNELSVRRSIWCWNDCTEGPSDAMWKVYGSKGIAIVSTVGLVRNAISTAGVQRGLVAPLSYTIPRRSLSVAAVAGHMLMIDANNLPFPYLFKNASYRFEEEIRFVVGNSFSAAPGITLDIDPKSFIEDVWISSEIVEPEQRLIRTLLDKSGSLCFELPLTAMEKKISLFNFDDTPATTDKDDIEGLFQDLGPI